MNLFGKKKQAPVPAPSPVETIAKLRDSLNILEKREDHITKKIDAALQEARLKSQKKDKNGALFALKRKKMYEAEVTKLQGARITLENQIMALESASVNIETFRAMKSGAAAMKQMRGDIDADKVDDIMDELQEEKDIQDAISEAITRPGQELFNDEELLDELAELDALEMEASLETKTQSAVQPQAQDSVFNFPSVPSKAPVSVSTASTAETDDERALRELEASMLA
jgi:charged multivesicular body protein 4A/B